jgi:CDP-6-deoxy-D-xylo-4-hexulose-3-dehydrase
MSAKFWPLMPNIITLKDKFRLIKFILSTNFFTSGKMVAEFERLWSKWVGAKHSLFVSSGSTANFLLLSAVIEKYGLEKGDKVLVPACTWMTNVAPVFQLGLTPIFCDINFKNFSFDENEMLKIKKKHPDIKIIFVTHLLGFPAARERYQEIFPDAIILDDVCESHGCKTENFDRVGANTTGATFSFYFGHHMTTIEGGMISTNDSELYDLMKMKRSHGMARNSDNFKMYVEKYPHIEKSFLFVTDGYNFRNTELAAVLGISQLEGLDRSIEIRKNNFRRFVDIVNRHGDKFHTLTYTNRNSNFSLPMLARTKEVYDKLKVELEKAGIEYRPIVGGNLLRQPFLKGYKFAIKKKEYNADILNDLGVYVGNNQMITNKHLDALENILKGL